MTFSLSGESGNDVMNISGLSKAYPGKPLFDSVDFEVKKHDRLFLLGPNGCGKSTLVKILAGRLPADRGYVYRGHNVRIGYYDQENQDLHPENTVLGELWDAYPAMTETELRNTLALFLFKGEDVEKKVAVLSGGEKARLTLARLMLSKMNLLILDEPTNHLDIPSREILEQALLSFDGTLIAVSHDRYFTKKLATRILAFGEEKGKLFPFQGSYDEFLAYQKAHPAQAEEAKESAPVTASKEQYLSAKRNSSEARKKERRLRLLKEEISKLETRLSEIAEEMNGSAAFDASRLAALSVENEEAENRLLELYEELDRTEGL